MVENCVYFDIWNTSKNAQKFHKLYRIFVNFSLFEIGREENSLP